MNRFKVLPVLVISGALLAASAPAWAQKSYDDHELTDRFYITIGGFSQTDIRTTLRLDAKSPEAGFAIGTVIGLESLFDVDNRVSTGRIDGWYRFGKKHRIGWTYWRTQRDGSSTYNGDPIEIGDITINPGDSVRINDDSKLFAVNWSYSFLNTAKYEAWLGAGFNFQTIDTSIDANIGGGSLMERQEAKGTIPIPTINFGGRWSFSKRTRMILTQNIFGIQVGDYSGKLNNLRILAEHNLTKHFGIGGGFERFFFQVDADAENFAGSLDTSYTGLTLYLKGQI